MAEADDGSPIADGGCPVTINELVQLTQLGIPPDQITWSRVTLPSEKWICIRHETRDDNKPANVTVLNTQEGIISFTGASTADSVLMNPLRPIMALRAGLRFQVFNLESKVLMTTTKLHEVITYWTWVNPEVIAMVTDTAIYHWDLWRGDCPPCKLFNRHPKMSFSEIVSYKADPDMKWFALTGLYPENERISGQTQLYNYEEDLTQCISCHCCALTNYKFSDNQHESTVLCLASRDHNQHGKIYVIELGPYKPGNFAPRNSYDHILFFDDVDRYDFPVSIQASTELGLVYMLTKYGYFYLCDIETAECMCYTRISQSVLFSVAMNTHTQGIIGVNRAGQVLTVDVRKEALLSYMKETSKRGDNQFRRLEQAIS